MPLPSPFSVSQTTPLSSPPQQQPDADAKEVQALPLFLPKLAIGGASDPCGKDLATGRKLVPTDDDLVAVQRSAHPVSQSKTLFCLHDRLHGRSHKNCAHRNPDLLVHLRAENTSTEEHLNRGMIF
jgi:hypothetical protein